MEVMIFCIIGFVVFSFFNFPTLYQFQIKEYYFPRIRSAIKENNGFWIPLKFPAFSFRNFMILVFASIVTAGYFYFLYLKFNALSVSFALFWVLGTIVAKSATFIAVLLTEPLANIKRERLINIARQKAGSSKTVFIGVTGSYGKTSVKEFLIHILQKRFKVGGSKKNFNAEVGLAISVNELLKEDTQYFVAEMAAYRKGTIQKSASIVNPKIGFITGLGNQHISLFGSQQNIYDAKGELVESIPEDGIVYMNMDCEGYEYVKKKAKCKVVSYSLRSKAGDVYGEIIDPGNFKFQYNQHEEIFNTTLIGEHNVLNLLGVIACAIDLGIEIKKIKEAIKELHPLHQRLSVFRNEDGGVLIDDSYNINSEGFMSALKYLATYQNRKKFVFTRGMLELGSLIKEEYEKISKYCKDNSIQIVTTDKRFLGITDVVTIIDEKRIKDSLESFSEDVILLEGRFSPRSMKYIYEKYK